MLIIAPGVFPIRRRQLHQTPFVDPIIEEKSYILMDVASVFILIESNKIKITPNKNWVISIFKNLMEFCNEIQLKFKVVSAIDTHQMPHKPIHLINNSSSQ